MTGPGRGKKRAFRRKSKQGSPRSLSFVFFNIRSFEFSLYQNGIAKKSFTYLENQNKERERKTVLNPFFMWNVTY